MNSAGAKRSFKIVVADPAGNITAFVLDGSQYTADERPLMAQKIMEREIPFCAPDAPPRLVRVEQAGFMMRPDKPDKPEGEGAWRLEMAGGEFCGNAARSFALLAARMSGKWPAAGPLRLSVEVSGAAKPLEACIQQNTGGQDGASISMPLPVAKSTVCALGRELPVYHFEGISHVIAAGIEPDRAAFFAIRAAVETGFGINGLTTGFPSAIGVMFCPTGQEIFSMIPAVYVYNPETFMFESSCGSGSAAFAYHYFEDKEDGGAVVIRQPGGTIEAVVQKEAGRITGVEIGGPVVLSEPQSILF